MNADANVAEGVAPKHTAPVQVDGETLFIVRGIASFPAKTRASLIEERILAAAQDPEFDPATLRVEQKDGDEANLFAGDTLLVKLLRADAEAEGITVDVLGEYARTRVANAIDRYRADRSPKALTRSGLVFVLLTLLLLGGLWLLRRGWRRFEGFIDMRVASGVEAIERKSRRLIHSKQLWGLVRGILRLGYLFVLFVIAYLYVNSVLGAFPWTRSLAADLLWLVMTPLGYMVRAIAAEVPNLVFLVILFFVFRFILRLVKLFFLAVQRSHIELVNFDPDWAMPTYRILRVLIVAFGVVVAYPYIPGSESAAFKGVSIFLGLIFSLGSTSFIANMIAGLTMTYRGAYREGDWVRIGDVEGRVAEMRLMVMRLRTRKNELVTIPNSVILNTNVVNYSAPAGDDGPLVVHTQVGIGYDAPWREVEALLVRAALDTPGLRDDPPPFVHQKGLGDFAVIYEINAVGADPARLPQVYSDLHRNIQDRFNEAGIQIMSPAYVADPETPKIVPPDQWGDAPDDREGSKPGL